MPLFGGLAYLDYRGKLHQKPVGEEPFVTYERLDTWVLDLPLVVAFTCVVRESGDVLRNASHNMHQPSALDVAVQWE